MPKLGTEVGRKDSPAEQAKTQYWSPTLEAIDWSAAAAEKEEVVASTGLGMGPMVSLEAGAGAAVDFPTLAATRARGSKERDVKVYRRGISIQGKSREVKVALVGLEADARATSGEVRPWDFL